MRKKLCGSKALAFAGRLTICAGAAGLAVSAQGCYERVTRATGFGADQYQVSEPYQRNSAVDDWIFGKQDTTVKTGSRIPPTPQSN